jgi:hypothetical protein
MPCTENCKIKSARKKAEKGREGKERGKMPELYCTEQNREKFRKGED